MATRYVHLDERLGAAINFRGLKILPKVQRGIGNEDQ
jgi:hypothetical protein